MTQYKVTMTCDRNQLLRFIDLVGLDQRTHVEALPGPSEVPGETLAPMSTPTRRGAPRGPRGSKVNDAILRTLRTEPQTTKQLRTALESNGLAPGSLSTGLAILQRKGQVRRIGDGLYEMIQQAAE